MRLHTGAVLDDDEMPCLRDTLHTVGRRSLALSFDVGMLTCKRALKAGCRAVLEAKLARTQTVKRHAKVIEDEMKRRIEVLADLQHLAGVALDVNHVRQPRYVELGELGQPDSTRKAPQNSARILLWSRTSPSSPIANLSLSIILRDRSSLSAGSRPRHLVGQIA